MASRAPIDLPCTCHLLRKLARRVTQDYDRALAPAGLTITQFALLGHLRRMPGISVSALAAKMGMDRTTLVRTLRPVVKAGWARYGERGAGLAARLEPTAGGLERLSAARPLWRRAQSGLQASLGERRNRRLLRELAQSIEALEAR